MYPSAGINAAAVAAAAAARHPGPPQPGQPFKFTVIDSCDRIKEEFNFLQAQYHKALLCGNISTCDIELIPAHWCLGVFVNSRQIEREI
ncbi:hypothetical protein PV325_002357 [Microctonus aethiopoides]|nr:hypothetical protein PV325_002357 [Microctonus aethiopoides]